MEYWLTLGEAPHLQGCGLGTVCGLRASRVLLLCWSASVPGKLQHNSFCVGYGGFMNDGAFFFIVVFGEGRWEWVGWGLKGCFVLAKKSVG